MTVRLRPRQVLCSKCKGICNENSENVTRKRKNSDSVQLPIKRSANAPVTRSVHSETNKRRLHTDNKFLSPAARDCTTLTRNEQSSLKRRLLPSALSEEHCTIVTAIQDHLEADSRHSVEHSDYSQDQAATKRPLRKRKTGESSAAEDLWEEDDFGEETSRNNNQNTQNNANIDQRLLLTSSGGNSTCVNTRTIKISYGPQGEGTVLKIPAQIENLNVSDSEENIKIEATKLKDENNKAARKALKKAKKEARKKVLYAAAGGGTTLVPSYLGGSSPRLSGSSPRYLVGGASPRLGAVSPRYNMTCDVSSSRRKKHKVKHKKKHRDDKEKKHKEVVEEVRVTPNL